MKRKTWGKKKALFAAVIAFAFCLAGSSFALAQQDTLTPNNQKIDEAVILDDGARAVVKEEAKKDSSDLNQSPQKVEQQTKVQTNPNLFLAGKAFVVSKFINNPGFWFLIALAMMVPLLKKSPEEIASDQTQIEKVPVKVNKIVKQS